ncbi:hypothetical protein DL769_007626 [Monosporascus sp. CRB-8-3]|nr:hypothetical protein DL769_007626 [Monosporascus sp. CRB-8-3]
MPSFGRLTRHSNRSQHNLEQQQQEPPPPQPPQPPQSAQQQQHYHHRQHQHQHSRQQQSVSSSGSAAAPHPAPFATAEDCSGTATGLAISAELETPGTRPGGGVSNTLPSASSTRFSSGDRDSFQIDATQQPAQQQTQARSRSRSIKQRNRLSQHLFTTNHHDDSRGAQGFQGGPQEPFGSTNPNPPPSNLPPGAGAGTAATQLQQQHYHHSPVPLNQPTSNANTNTSTVATYTTPRQQHQHQHQHQHQNQHLHLDQQQQQQQQLSPSPPPPLPSNSGPRDNFAELVARSQSARQSLPQVSPIQTQLPRGVAGASVENLPQSAHLPSPILPQGSQTAPTEQKRSVPIRLFKTLVARASQYQQQNSYDNTAGLARRPSKRQSNLSPVRRDPSQISFEETPPDWQAQGSHQPSPLQGAGEADEHYLIGRSNQDALSQNSPYSQNSIRQVPADVDSSSYGQTDQQRLQLYGQIAADPSQARYQYVHPDAQYQASNRQSPYVGQLSTSSSQLTNAETVSQLSYESPIVDSDHQANAQSSQQASPAVNYGQQELLTHQNQQQVAPSATQSQTMAPPPTGPASNRRPGDKDQLRASTVEPPPGPPPNYRHSQSQLGGMNNLPPTPGGPPGNQSFRTSTVADRQPFDGSGQEAGRNSPQPSMGDGGSDPDKQFKDLLTKYKNVKRLYFDGKTHVEQLTAQVEQLQNAVANQRMSQSRTALDDNEYSTRFNRLNGAINNLAFNIRKDWRTLPEWIENYVSPDAIKTGKQEMTAVGRAVIIRWIVDEVFNKCFHPGLDVNLSSQLKVIEQNIRKFSYTLNSQEEYDALTAKVVNWRMATLEGLQHVLQAPESNDYRADFTKMIATNLTAELYKHLSDPPPPGVDGSASMIIELAVGIAANLPLESRDVAITYPLPGDPIQLELMDLEKTGLPPLAEYADAAEESGKDGDKASKRDKTKSAPPKDPNKVRTMSAASAHDEAGESHPDKPTHLEPSELGTKEYWDRLYDREMRNHAHDPSDTGTVWFDDSDAEARMIEFLLPEPEPEPGPGPEEPPPPAEPERDGRRGASFLDLGTGNGSLLFGLRDAGFAGGRMLGVDYSARSVEFARRIAGARAAGSRAGDAEGDGGEGEADEEEEEEEERGGRAEIGERGVEFRLHDILRDDPGDLLTGAQAAGWDVVLDKGTFDAISLSAEDGDDGDDGGGAQGEGRSESAGRGAATTRACEAYPRRVLPLVRPGGLFLVTSCNWTEDELRRWFLGDDAVIASTTTAAAAAATPTTTTEGKEEWGFEQVGRVEYPSFSFGGVKGQTISTLCFRKVRR